MALVKCEECGNRISDKAQTCPQCGAPVVKGVSPPKKKTSVVTWVVAILFGFWVFAWFSSREAQQKPAATQPAAQKPDPKPLAAVALSPEDQTKSADVKSMESAVVCEEVGKNLRLPPSQKDESYAKFLLTRAKDDFGVSSEDYYSIRNSKLRTGMSWCSLFAAWGRPDKANSTTTAAGANIQWVYWDNRYAYTQNGLITAWQQ
jgi:hypothetical protein